MHWQPRQSDRSFRWLTVASEKIFIRLWWVGGNRRSSPEVAPAGQSYSSASYAAAVGCNLMS